MVPHEFVGIEPRPSGLSSEPALRAQLMEAMMSIRKSVEPTTTNKLDQIVASLSKKHGASAIDLAALTGCQLHSVRGALSRLRRRGHDIQRRDTPAGSRYQLVKPKSAMLVDLTETNYSISGLARSAVHCPMSGGATRRRRRLDKRAKTTGLQGHNDQACSDLHLSSRPTRLLSVPAPGACMTELTMARSKPATATPVRNTKLAQILSSISTKQGCSTPELMTLTGWQSHSVRGALSRLRSQGHSITCLESPEGCRYRLVKTR